MVDHEKRFSRLQFYLMALKKRAIFSIKKVEYSYIAVDNNIMAMHLVGLLVVDHYIFFTLCVRSLFFLHEEMKKFEKFSSKSIGKIVHSIFTRVAHSALRR